MITIADLDAAIAECQGERNPDARTCIKLAAYYTIRNAMTERPVASDYSLAPAPVQSKAVNSYVIDYDSDSDFGQMIHGRKPQDVWPIIDELMDVLLATNPRLYNGVMRKIDNLD